MSQSESPQRIYLDYCATTPIAPEVLNSMMPALEGDFGNPSSLHAFGRKAKSLIETARSQVAKRIDAQPQEIVFTSGATEANNLALFGSTAALNGLPGHLITSSIEHHAVLHAAHRLESNGWKVTYLPVDHTGRVRVEDVAKAIQPDTHLISLMMVNNEVGTIQPIQEVSKIARSAGILVHTDAVQALGLLPVSVEDLGVDMLSLSGHKIYGPKGVGALFVRQGIIINPVLVGGPQEGQRRAGTENVPGIVGLGMAAELSDQKKDSERDRLQALREYLINSLKSRFDHFQINGSTLFNSPHVISITFFGADGEMLLFLLNQKGVAVSMGSACNSKEISPSHVLLAMGLAPEEADATLRISLGYSTTRRDIDSLLEILPQLVEQCRQVKYNS